MEFDGRLAIFKNDDDARPRFGNPIEFFLHTSEKMWLRLRDYKIGGFIRLTHECHPHSSGHPISGVNVRTFCTKIFRLVFDRLAKIRTLRSNLIQEGFSFLPLSGSLLTTRLLTNVMTHPRQSEKSSESSLHALTVSYRLNVQRGDARAFTGGLGRLPVAPWLFSFPNWPNSISLPLLTLQPIRFLTISTRRIILCDGNSSCIV